MDKLAQYLNIDQTTEIVRVNAGALGVREFAVVKNLDYIFSPVEIYPLAPRTMGPLPDIAAVAMDMDGTSTTTEPLALNSLEYMVRRFTGRMTKEEWAGLDVEMDYPYIIGNSNFRHTEFLVKRYESEIRRDALRDAFFEAMLWTLSNIEDNGRRKDITQNAVNCGLGALIEDSEFKALVDRKVVTDENVAEHAAPFVAKYGGMFRTSTPTELVAACLDIYYTRYHTILKRIEAGEGDKLSEELLGSESRHLIEPMPGFAIYMAMIKGLLGDEIDKLFNDLKRSLLANSHVNYSEQQIDSKKPVLKPLAAHFRKHPAKTALVTASIFYEAHVCMKEIMHVASLEIENWPIPDNKKQRVLEEFSDYRNVYEGFVTATDASEARLKPHRDLYSIALYQMSVPREQYPNCIVLEDTEPGIISARAAGIGLACALPNRDTTRQDYSAACHILHGGLPELILFHNSFLSEKGERT
jgi:beta-phosphoglucomutase-like phosphatase (HAD superfamily)